MKNALYATKGAASPERLPTPTYYTFTCLPIPS